MRRVALLLVIAGCGRVNFDPLPFRDEAYLKASNPDAGDFFGETLALSGDGNTLVVGAHWEAGSGRGINPPDDNATAYAGAVYIYERVSGAWQFSTYLKADNTETDDRFGLVSLSNDGNTLVVTAYGEGSAVPGDESNALPASGSAYVYERSGLTWQKTAHLKASNASANLEFGTSLALSGDGSTLAVSAILDNSGATGVDGDQQDHSVTEAGAVYMFARNGATWTQQAYLKSSNPDLYDEFGSSIAISADGNIVATNAPDESSSGTGVGADGSDNLTLDSGAVYVFARIGGTWSGPTFIKSSMRVEGGNFGCSLALDATGTLLAAGATEDRVVGGGSVHILEHTGGTWIERAIVRADIEDLPDQFGRSVALSPDGRLLVVGSTGEASGSTGLAADPMDNSISNAGAIYVFSSIDPSRWSQTAYIKPLVTSTDLFFGSTVALSADASTIAASAPGDAGSGAGTTANPYVPSTRTGAIYVFQ